jgi:hypothetical protein
MVVTFVQMHWRSCIGQVALKHLTGHGGKPVGSCAATIRILKTMAVRKKAKKGFMLQFIVSE